MDVNNQDTALRVTETGARIFDVAVRTTLGPGTPKSIYPPSVSAQTMFDIQGDSAYMENIWLWRGDHWNQYKTLSSDDDIPGTDDSSGTDDNPHDDCADDLPCVINSCYKPQDCHPGIDPFSSELIRNKDPFDCGYACNQYNAKSNSQQPCDYWKQRGTWCGFYMADAEEKLDTQKENLGFDNCDPTKDDDSADPLSTGISTLALNASCCTFEDSELNNSNSDCDGSRTNCDGVHWCCDTGTGPMGWGNEAYNALTENGDLNKNSIGLRVRGDKCVGIGLFVEHQTCFPILWEGNEGTIIFSQGETSYRDECSDDTSWDTELQKYNTKAKGTYLTLGGAVTDFYFNGGGIYSVFNAGTVAAIAIFADSPNDDDDVQTTIRIQNLVVGAWCDGGFEHMLYENWNDTFSGGALRETKQRFCSLESLKKFNSDNAQPECSRGHFAVGGTCRACVALK